MKRFGDQLSAVFVIALTLSSVACFAEEKITTDDLIAKHLAAIGTTEARTGNRLRSGDGSATLDIVSGGSGHMEGISKVASMGRQFNFIMYFNATNYNGEQFKFDGTKTFVADNTVDRRLNLAFFMYRHDVILKEGLWGGIWNSGWPLNDLTSHNAAMKYEGAKKFNGKELLQFLYKPQHSEREIIIHLFFEPDTFRHVRSEYDFIGPIGSLPAITVTEEFADFRSENGLMLPHSWKIRYEPGQLGAVTMRWQVAIQKVSVTAASAKAAPPQKKDN